MKRKLFTTLIIALCAMLANGCLSEKSGKHDPAIQAWQLAPGMVPALFVTTSDYTVGRTAVIYGYPPSTPILPSTSVSGDTAVRVLGTKIFVINRYGFDNIQVLDQIAGYSTVSQFSMGAGSNPMDIAILNVNKAYVSRLQNASLWVGNPLSGVQTGAINLTAYADADGVPEAAGMVIINNRLFVALQKLDSNNFFCPTGQSSVVVINTETDQPVTEVKLLATTNPVARLIFNAAENKIYVGSAGKYESLPYCSTYTGPNGGVETITVDTVNDTYTPNGLVISEATLGGDISQMAVVSATQAYALVSDTTFTNYLVRFNPSTGQKVSTIYTSSAYLPDMVLDSQGYLYLADRDFTTPGVRVWSTAIDAQIVAPLNTDLPPYGLAPMQ